MTQENKNELIQAITNNDLREAHFKSKWYGSYYTDLYISCLEKNNLFDIRKADYSANYSHTKTHFCHTNITADEVINILKRVRKNTYVAQHITTHTEWND